MHRIDQALPETFSALASLNVVGQADERPLGATFMVPATRKRDVAMKLSRMRAEPESRDAPAKSVIPQHSEAWEGALAIDGQALPSRQISELHTMSHMPGHYREAFADAVEVFIGWKDGEPEPRVDFEGSLTPIRRICGLLWNCSDILPSSLLDDVRAIERPLRPLRRGTYASAARLMMLGLIGSD